jgi:hypothetical protein
MPLLAIEIFHERKKQLDFHRGAASRIGFNLRKNLYGLAWLDLPVELKAVFLCKTS